MISIESSGAEVEFDSLAEASEFIATMDSGKTIELTISSGEGPESELMKIAFDPTAESLADAIDRAKRAFIEARPGMSNGHFTERKFTREF